MATRNDVLTKIKETIQAVAGVDDADVLIGRMSPHKLSGAKRFFLIAQQERPEERDGNEVVRHLELIIGCMIRVDTSANDDEQSPLNTAWDPVHLALEDISHGAQDGEGVDIFEQLNEDPDAGLIYLSGVDDDRVSALLSYWTVRYVRDRGTT